MNTHPPRVESYLALMAQHPEWFGTPSGGVHIVTDPSGISAVEAEVGARYAARGMPATWAEVGIQYRDPYLMVLRDAVVFLDGSVGVHHRAVRLGPEASGVTILPLLGRQILLLRHFRHPTRQWHWEFPRGAIDAGFTAEGAVRAELMEEAQAIVSEILPLGRMYGATGFMGLAVLLYAARIDKAGTPALGEGISDVRLVDVEEMEQMIAASEITDGFTLGAFLHARLRGLV
jgi:ADP-ribose pyrophosphatase